MGLRHDRYVQEGGASAHPAYGYVNQRTFATGATRSSRWRTIDVLRGEADLERFAWTDPGLTAGVTPVRLVHLLELREALAAAYAAAGRPVPRWTDAAPTGSTPIRAAHLTELRAAVTALE